VATKFVFSGAVGANDGTSWANAWTSEASSNGVAAGDVVKVHKTHSGANNGANINWSNGTFSNPVRLICVDKDAGDALASGAVFNWNVTNTGPQGSLFAYGITFATSGANLRLSPPNSGYQRYENCTLTVTGATGIDFTSATSRNRIDFINTSVNFSGASAATVNFGPFLNTATTIFNWTGGTYTCRSTQTNLIGASQSTTGSAVFRGVKFSGTVTNLFTASTNISGIYRFDGCEGCAYTNIFNAGTVPTNMGNRINLDGFVSGTLTAPHLRPNVEADGAGTLRALTSVYRTGGAWDGEQANPYSWEIASTSNANNSVLMFETPQIARFVEAGEQTLTFYVAGGALLNDDEFWPEVLSPSEAVSPTAQFRYQSLRCDPLATPEAWPVDSTSVWNGSGVGSKQVIQVQINPTMAGVVLVHFNFAKPSSVCYVDPKVAVL